MSPRAKQQLYHSLAQLLRAGLTFPRALEKLSTTTHGATRQASARIRRSLQAGKTVAEACADARPMIGAMEAAVLTAVERAGSLDRGLEQLSAHFAAIASARGKIFAKLAYPVFVLVLGVLLLNLPMIVQQGRDAYLRTTLMLLGGFALAVVALVLSRNFVAALATFSATADSFVRALPLIGGMQRAFAMSRFCLAYDLQLAAGINTLNALESAASASRSGLVRSAIARLIPKIRTGAQVGPLLAQTSAFDPEVAQGIIVGEESGSLDKELRRLAEDQSERAFARLNALAEWLPRLVYIGVLGYVGYSIIRVYQNYLGQIRSLIDGM
jgi:type IV pilus assembly protein PilC